MLAVELGSPDYTLRVAKRCMEKGLIVFNCTEMSL